MDAFVEASLLSEYTFLRAFVVRLAMEQLKNRGFASAHTSVNPVFSCFN